MLDLRLLMLMNKYLITRDVLDYLKKTNILKGPAHPHRFMIIVADQTPTQVGGGWSYAGNYKRSPDSMAMSETISYSIYCIVQIYFLSFYLSVLILSSELIHYTYSALKNVYNQTKRIVSMTYTWLFAMIWKQSTRMIKV